jgi:hypothetical protein
LLLLMCLAAACTKAASAAQMVNSIENPFVLHQPLSLLLRTRLLKRTGGMPRRRADARGRCAARRTGAQAPGAGAGGFLALPK